MIECLARRSGLYARMQMILIHLCRGVWTNSDSGLKRIMVFNKIVFLTNRKDYFHFTSVRLRLNNIVHDR